MFRLVVIVGTGVLWHYLLHHMGNGIYVLPGLLSIAMFRNVSSWLTLFGAHYFVCLCFVLVIH